MLPEVLSFCNEQTEVGLAHLSQSGNGGKIFLHYILRGHEDIWLNINASCY